MSAPRFTLCFEDRYRVVGHGPTLSIQVVADRYHKEPLPDAWSGGFTAKELAQMVEWLTGHGIPRDEIRFGIILPSERPQMEAVARECIVAFDSGPKAERIFYLRGAPVSSMASYRLRPIEGDTGGDPFSNKDGFTYDPNAAVESIFDDLPAPPGDEDYTSDSEPEPEIGGQAK